MNNEPHLKSIYGPKTLTVQYKSLRKSLIDYKNENSKFDPFEQVYVNPKFYVPLIYKFLKEHSFKYLAMLRFFNYQSSQLLSKTSNTKIETDLNKFMIEGKIIKVEVTSKTHHSNLDRYQYGSKVYSCNTYMIKLEDPKKVEKKKEEYSFGSEDIRHKKEETPIDPNAFDYEIYIYNGLPLSVKKNNNETYFVPIFKPEVGKKYKFLRHDFSPITGKPSDQFLYSIVGECR